MVKEIPRGAISHLEYYDGREVVLDNSGLEKIVDFFGTPLQEEDRDAVVEIFKYANGTPVEFYSNAEDGEIRIKNGRVIYFYLNNTGLSCIPDSFGNLTELRELYVHNNQLSQLPDNFVNLKKLENLFIHNNQLSQLSDNFGDLISLEDLYMGDNGIFKLPSNFRNLVNLKNFYAENNNFDSESMGILYEMGGSSFGEIDLKW